MTVGTELILWTATALLVVVTVAFIGAELLPSFLFHEQRSSYPGADRTNVITLVLRGAFSRVVIGLILGLPLAIGAGRLISSQLYGVSFWDPLALAAAAGSLAICAFFAALVPAGRAASISPMRALRTE